MILFLFDVDIEVKPYNVNNKLNFANFQPDENAEHDFRAALVIIGQRVGSVLAPLQLGVGFPHGCEIAVLENQPARNAGEADNLVLLSLDIKNAYNTMARGCMLTGLREFAPELLHWFLWSYGRRTSPLFYQGEHVADVSTGCKQGDPLSSLCLR